MLFITISFIYIYFKVKEHIKCMVDVNCIVYYLLGKYAQFILSVTNNGDIDIVKC